MTMVRGSSCKTGEGQDEVIVESVPLLAGYGTPKGLNLISLTAEILPSSTNPMIRSSG
jgi:hypothetical protein